jgi:hypothetical protein
MSGTNKTSKNLMNPEMQNKSFSKVEMLFAAVFLDLTRFSQVTPHLSPLNNLALFAIIEEDTLVNFNPVDPC